MTAGHYTTGRDGLVWVGPTREETLVLRQAFEQMLTVAEQPDALGSIRRILAQYVKFCQPVATRTE